MMEKTDKVINEAIGYLYLNPSCQAHSPTLILLPCFQEQSEIEATPEIVQNPLNRVGHICEFKIWKYMEDDKAVSRHTK